MRETGLRDSRLGSGGFPHDVACLVFQNACLSEKTVMFALSQSKQNREMFHNLHSPAVFHGAAYLGLLRKRLPRGTGPRALWLMRTF